MGYFRSQDNQRWIWSSGSGPWGTKFWVSVNDPAGPNYGTGTFVCHSEGPALHLSGCTHISTIKAPRRVSEDMDRPVGGVPAPTASWGRRPGLSDHQEV